MVDVVIVGAGTAGLSAAIYSCRADMSTLVFEQKMYGGQIVTSSKVENYPGINSISGFEFATNLYNQAKSLGAQIVMEKVIAIEKNDNERIYKWKVKTTKADYECKTVIIATGLVHKELEIEGSSAFEGKGLSYCATCDGAFYKDMDVAVYGGGNTAASYALFLSKYCKKVYLIYRRNQMRAAKRLTNILENTENVELVPECTIAKINGDKDSGRIESITVNNSNKNEEAVIDIKGLFVAIGHKPVNELFSNIVNVNESGYIVALEDCKTDVEGIFVAGDCRTKSVRQLATAASDGAIAALAAVEYISFLPLIG